MTARRHSQDFEGVFLVAGHQPPTRWYLMVPQIGQTGHSLGAANLRVASSQVAFGQSTGIQVFRSVNWCWSQQTAGKTWGKGGFRWTRGRAYPNLWPTSLHWCTPSAGGINAAMSKGLRGDWYGNLCAGLNRKGHPLGKWRLRSSWSGNH